MNNMNVLKVYPNHVMFFNDSEIENGEFTIGSDGVLEVKGNMVVADYSFDNIYDAEILKKVRDKFINKTFLFKRDFIPSGWFEYKETRRFTYTTSNYIVKEYYEELR